MERDSTFNAMFLDRTSSDGQLQKAAALQSDVVRNKVWEEGFARKLFPPKDVDRNDPHIQEDIKTDTIYYLEHGETVSYAMTANIRGNGHAHVWFSKKYPISFHKIETEHLTTDEMTIRSMPYPFVKDMEGKFPLWIQMVEDRELILHLETCVQTVQAWDNGGAVDLTASALQGPTPPRETAVRKSEIARNEATDNFNIQIPQRQDFAYMARMFPGFRGESLIGENVLITETDFQGFNTWEFNDIGGEGAWKVTQDGYTIGTVIGHKFVRTNKTSILRPGNMFMFAQAQFGGKFLRFVDITVAMERYGDRVESWAWEVIGMGFANLRFVKKCELYSGSVVPGFAPAGAVDVQPLSEELIVTDNLSRIDVGETGGYVPVIF